MRKTIFVTGANGGLGQGIVKYFLDQNYNVIAVVRPGKAMPLHENLTILESEIDNEEDVVQLFNKIAHNKISIDAGLLVAGGFAIKSFLETSLEDLQSMMNKNFYTSFFVAKHLVRHWKDNNESGKIIFTGAKAALEKGGEATAAYSLSKSVLVKLVEIINEIAKSNVSASMVAPSIIDTPANRKAMPNANFEDWVKPEKIAHQMEFIINDPDVMAEVFIKAYKNS
jgi:NAD(P)-dependent dehydrogenase (short-subunit alcohol dehydrogenase family)